jgi:hypothetical protein
MYCIIQYDTIRIVSTGCAISCHTHRGLPHAHNGRGRQIWGSERPAWNMNDLGGRQGAVNREQCSLHILLCKG